MNEALVNLASFRLVSWLSNFLQYFALINRFASHLIKRFPIKNEGPLLLFVTMLTLSLAVRDWSIQEGGLFHKFIFEHSVYSRWRFGLFKRAVLSRTYGIPFITALQNVSLQKVKDLKSNHARLLWIRIQKAYHCLPALLCRVHLLLSLNLLMKGAFRRSVRMKAAMKEKIIFGGTIGINWIFFLTLCKNLKFVNLI